MTDFYQPNHELRIEFYWETSCYYLYLSLLKSESGRKQIAYRLKQLKESNITEGVLHDELIHDHLVRLGDVLEALGFPEVASARIGEESYGITADQYLYLAEEGLFRIPIQGSFGIRGGKRFPVFPEGSFLPFSKERLFTLWFINTRLPGFCMFPGQGLRPLVLGPS